MEHTAAKVSITSLPKSIVLRIVSKTGFHPLPLSPGLRELESDKLKPAAARRSPPKGPIRPSLSLQGAREGC